MQLIKCKNKMGNKKDFYKDIFFSFQAFHGTNETKFSVWNWNLPLMLDNSDKFSHIRLIPKISGGGGGDSSFL